MVKSDARFQHTGGNADRNIEHVVNHQRCRRHESGHRPQIFFRDNIRTAAVGVGRNGLAIRGRDNS